MKKLIVLIALTSLCISNTAFAISDTGENSLGVYFDFDTFDVSCYDPPQGFVFTMYFVMANCTQPSIGGFEFGWEVTPPGTEGILAPSFPSGGVNFGSSYNYIVGFSTPLPTGPATVLVGVLMILLTPQAADISVGPSTPSSVGGVAAAFSDGLNPSLLFNMNYATVDGTNVVIDGDGWVRPGIGGFYCIGPVSSEEMSWGGVKSLYR